MRTAVKIVLLRISLYEYELSEAILVLVSVFFFLACPLLEKGFIVSRESVCKYVCQYAVVAPKILVEK